MNFLDAIQCMVSDKKLIRLNNSYYSLTDETSASMTTDHLGRVIATKNIPVIKRVIVQDNIKTSEFIKADSKIFSLEEVLNIKWELDINIEALQEMPESEVEKAPKEVSMVDLVGCIVTSIKKEDNILRFYTEDGVWEMYHEQECCEEVYIESIDGELEDLIDTPILRASEEISTIEDNDKNVEESDNIWTFYKLATIKGYVTIRWHGSSNGFYSEKVSLFFTPSKR